MQPRDLSGHEAYVAGRGIEETARELGVEPDELVKLASNENPLGPSPAAIEAIRESASRVHAYPKASHTDLQAAIAEKWGVAPEQAWLAPSGDVALDYLARATIEPGDRVLVPDPGFAYYPMSARYHHGAVDSYRLRIAEDFAYGADAVLDAYDDHRVVYLTTPHNPTGAELSPEAIELIAEETDEETLVVVDEAYGEFTDRPSAVELLDGREDRDGRDDVAILRTFSKAYGLAGMRVGYALVPEAWADAYARVNTPFGVTEPSCRAALAALEDRDHVEQTIHVTRWAREYVRDAAVAPTFESGGNFVLVDVRDAPAAEIAAGLPASVDPDAPAPAVSEALKRRGIIVRDCTSFGLPGCVRITCGTENETRRAVSELNEVLGS